MAADSHRARERGGSRADLRRAVRGPHLRRARPREVRRSILRHRQQGALRRRRGTLLDASPSPSLPCASSMSHLCSFSSGLGAARRLSRAALGVTDAPTRTHHSLSCGFHVEPRDIPLPRRFLFRPAGLVRRRAPAPHAAARPGPRRPLPRPRPRRAAAQRSSTHATTRRNTDSQPHSMTRGPAFLRAEYCAGIESCDTH